MHRIERFIKRRKGGNTSKAKTLAPLLSHTHLSPFPPFFSDFGEDGPKSGSTFFPGCSRFNRQFGQTKPNLMTMQCFLKTRSLFQNARFWLDRVFSWGSSVWSTSQTKNCSKSKLTTMQQWCSLKTRFFFQANQNQDWTEERCFFGNKFLLGKWENNKSWSKWHNTQREAYRKETDSRKQCTKTDLNKETRY